MFDPPSHAAGAAPFLNLWTAIGTITTAGVVTEYPLPSAVAYTVGLTVGPDGALWFAVVSGKIGRIPSATTLRVFPAKLATKSVSLDKMSH